MQTDRLLGQRDIEAMPKGDQQLDGRLALIASSLLARLPLFNIKARTLPFSLRTQRL
jgi:hypothetical protein